MENLINQAVALTSLSKLTKACGLASTNSIRKWVKANRIPLNNEADYPGIIQEITKDTESPITRAMIWRQQLDDIKPGFVYKLPVETLQEDAQQPREQFDNDSLQDLSDSILKDGQQTPIKFRINDSNSVTPLMIVHGERRWRACCNAKIKTVDGILDTHNDEDEAECIFRQISDNMSEALTPWDWANTFYFLNAKGYSDNYISEKLAERGIKGFSRPVISNHRRLFNLPKIIQTLIKEQWLSPSHGKYLLQIKNRETKDNITQKLLGLYDKGELTPPIINLETLIKRALTETSKCLTSYNNDGKTTKFNVETECQGCKKKQKFSGDIYCFDSECWEDKQKENTQQQAPAPFNRILPEYNKPYKKQLIDDEEQTEQEESPSTDNNVKHQAPASENKDATEPVWPTDGDDTTPPEPQTGIDAKYGIGVEIVSNDDKARCPHCGKSHLMEPKDYDQSGIIKQCVHCSMKFTYRTRITHITRPEIDA